MDGVFKKLNLGSCNEILVLNAPEAFDEALLSLEDVSVRRSVPRKRHMPFAIGFAVTLKELQSVSRKLASATEGDAVVWVAYPKKSSKKYSCEFNRDTDWSDLGDAGFEPVRQIALDEDWSALRFRRAEFIKKMTRSGDRAISKIGKQRLSAKK